MFRNPPIQQSPFGVQSRGSVSLREPLTFNPASEISASSDLTIRYRKGMAIKGKRFKLNREGSLSHKTPGDTFRSHKVNRRGLNTLRKNEMNASAWENREDCNLLARWGGKKEGIFYYCFYFSVSYVFYMSIIVYSFEKLVFDNEALFCS